LFASGVGGVLDDELFRYKVGDFSVDGAFGALGFFGNACDRWVAGSGVGICVFGEGDEYELCEWFADGLVECPVYGV
jgi:hypothetical protein